MTRSFEMIDEAPSYNLYINGEWTRSFRNESAKSVNPATGELFAWVQQAGGAETKRAISAAHGAYKAWAGMPVSERETIFFRAADVLANKAKEITEVLILESGSIAGKAGFEVGYCLDLLRTAAAEMRRSSGETMPITAPGQFGFTVRQPLGVIAGIAPFNAPFLLAMKKVVLALAAGNSVVLKPSELTPVTGLKIAEVFDEAGLPAGLLNVISGPASAIGAAIFADPRVRMITFTGSTQTGRRLAVEAAKMLKRFTLEMGGKSPLIILGDADIDYAVKAAGFGIFFHQGQVCMANSRILVEEPIFDAFCERFTEIAKSLKVGDPRELDTAIGPLIRRSQCAIIDSQIEDAVNKGAKLLCGATHKDQYYWPTVLSGVTPDMRIFHEESFGPVTSIMKVRNHKEALKLANATDYGLSSGIITNDMQKALDLAFGLDSGMVHLNDCTVSDEPHAPFGGVKNSGFGREGGHFSIEEMTELKWITIQRGQRVFPI
ncbi:MAG TPA: aldehyde dehydrogenase family protein [Chthoniobacterales bacterium]